jgi:hypothetical protein
MSNPWSDLSLTPPFSLDKDKKALEKNKHQDGTFSELRLEVLPVPFLGSLEKAQVVLLNLNPGFVNEDLEYIKDNDYVEQNRKCLTFESDYPLFYLDPRFSYTAGYKWWYMRLKFFVEKFGNKIVSEKFMCIEYFPYHSRGFKKINELLPSQEFSFALVKKAIESNKLIVVMRSKKLWLENISELENYPYIELKNPRSPYISRNNMTEKEFNTLLSRVM